MAVSAQSGRHFRLGAGQTAYNLVLTEAEAAKVQANAKAHCLSPQDYLQRNFDRVTNDERLKKYECERASVAYKPLTDPQLKSAIIEDRPRTNPFWDDATNRM